MLARLFPRRTALALGTFVAVLTGVTAAWAVVSDREVTDAEASELSSEPPPPPANTEEASLFMRLGLAADALCAAGVRSTGVQPLCDAANAAMAANPTTLRDLDEAYGAAKVNRDQLKRKVTSGLASAAEVQALAQAEATLTNAKQARVDYVDAVRVAALATVSSSIATTLDQVHDNSDWRLPVEFLVEDRTEQDWVDLRDALATERIAGKYSGPFPTSVQTQLATYRGSSAVATATTNLSTYLASVQTAWNTAVTPE